MNTIYKSARCLSFLFPVSNVVNLKKKQQQNIKLKPKKKRNLIIVENLMGEESAYEEVVLSFVFIIFVFTNITKKKHYHVKLCQNDLIILIGYVIR